MTTFCPTAYGVSSEVGKRPSQQDDFLIQEDIFGDKEHYLYAVFDGHGEQGDKVSKAVKTHLSKIMPGRKDAFVRDSRQAMIDVFQDISEMLGVDPDIDIYMSGTTAAVAIVTPTKVVAANLGDCRIVVGQKISELPVPSEEHQILYRPLVLTRDHTCADAKERIRVEQAGARVAKNPSDSELKDAPLRIYKGSLPYPGLVMTRSFGDSSAHKVGLISEPEVTIHTFTEIDKFLVLGTDGVWDALSNRKVVHLISEIPYADKASHQLAKKSLKYLDRKGIDDNTTNIVVFVQTLQCK